MATLSNKIVVVTGAARGIGAGIVEALLAEGALVVLADRDAAQLQEAVATLDPQGSRTSSMVADVTSETDISALVAEAVSRFGRLDGWVNNAGIVSLGPALDESAEIFGRQFAVNVAGLFACAKAAARQFIGQGGGGGIVNIASNAGKVGFPSQAGYNASKAAVINLTRNLAAEWAVHGINVNAVCPGAVDTPMLRGVAQTIASETGQDAEALFASFVPRQLQRHVQPREVGNVVAFLLSDAAAIIRGQSINVDGGETPY